MQNRLNFDIHDWQVTADYYGGSIPFRPIAQPTRTHL